MSPEVLAKLGAQFPDQPSLPTDLAALTASYPGLCLVVEVDGRRAALLVDSLVGQQQVVVKALDTNLQKMLSKQMTPEKAMAQTAADWEKITNRRGRAKQVRALRAQQAAWPKVL